MNDADFDGAVQAELAHVDKINTFLEVNPARHAAAGSDLAADEDRFPHIWAASVARRSLKHACECIQASAALMLNSNWLFPQFALLRAAYESAGSAVWLLEPNDPELRLARLLWQHDESWRFSARAFEGTPLDDDGEHQERREWAQNIAAELNIDLKKGKSGGFENLIRSIEDLPGEPESMLTAWRVSSGVSHAKTWAMKTVTIEVESTELYEHGVMSGRVANLELFLTFIGVARRVVLRGWDLYEIRTSPRPHPMSPGS